MAFSLANSSWQILYQRREDWPEQDCLIDWLQRHGNCREIGGADLETGAVAAPLAELWRQAPPCPPSADGARMAADLIHRTLAAHPVPATAG